MLADVSGCPNLSREPCSVSNAGSELYQGWWHCRKISTSPHNDITQPIIIFPEFLLDHSIIMSTVYIYIYTLHCTCTSCSLHVLSNSHYHGKTTSGFSYHEQRPNLSQSCLEASHGTGMDGGGGQIRSGDFLSRCIQENHPNGSNWRFFRTLKPQHS